LLLVDEHTEFAGNGEVEQRHEVGCGHDALVLLRCHVRERGGEERAAEAVADRVHFLLADRLLDRVQRGDRTF